MLTLKYNKVRGILTINNILKINLNLQNITIETLDEICLNGKYKLLSIKETKKYIIFLYEEIKNDNTEKNIKNINCIIEKIKNINNANIDMDNTKIIKSTIKEIKSITDKIKNINRENKKLNLFGKIVKKYNLKIMLKMLKFVNKKDVIIKLLSFTIICKLLSIIIIIIGR